MRPSLPAALMAAFLLSSPSLAQPAPPSCVSLEAAKERITASTLAFDVLSGDRAARAIAVLQDAGQADEGTDTVVIGVVLNPESNDIDLVLFFGTGGICKAVKIPSEAMMKVFNHIYGYKA